MYSFEEFDDWIRSFANVEMKLPADEHVILYEISAPPSGLQLRIDPKISIDQEKIAGSPELHLVTHAGAEVFVGAVPSNSSSWKGRFGELIAEALRNWREYVDDSQLRIA